MALLPDPSRAGIAVRLSLFYAAYFAMIGVQLPFWPVWLASRGLGPTEIGLLLALAAGVRVVAAPLIANGADRLGRRRQVLLALAAAAVAVYASFALAHGIWPLLAVTVAFTVMWSPVLPVAETLINLTVLRRGLQYGPIRLWGSLSFIAAAVIGGRVLGGRPESAILWLLFGLVAVTAASCALLPEVPPAAGERRPPLRAVTTGPGFLLFLATAGLIQSTHGVYYGFGTLYWKSVGHSEALIGWLWAEGVIAEVALFACGGALSRRLGPSTLILVGALAAVVRWTVTGLTDALPALLAVQALHAFTYGATHLGAINFIMRAVPANLGATAMSLYSSVISGLAMGASVLVAGPLYATFGGRAYLAMAGIGVLAVVLSLALMRRAPGSPPTVAGP